mgnify:FL=1
MSKIVVLNDTHFGVRNSSDIFIEYHRRFFEETLFPYLKRNNIKQILHLGDLYDHRKYINFKVQHASRKMFLEKIHEMGISMDIIIGNHDTYYKSTNDLNSLKELLGYFTSNINIVTEPRVLDYDGLRIGLVPWINSENYTESIRFIKTCDAPWLAGHLELAGFDLMPGMKATDGMSPDLFSRFETVLSGHYHTKSEQGNIKYLGSQMEFTWADAGDPKYFHVIDTETRTVEQVRCPIRVFEKIYYDDRKMNYFEDYDVSDLENKFVKVVVIHKSDPFTFDRFIDRIQQIDHHDLKIAENFDEFLGENVDVDEQISVEDTTELLDSYIENTETDLEKDRLKELMRSVYVEAVNQEIV